MQGHPLASSVGGMLDLACMGSPEFDSGAVPFAIRCYAELASLLKTTTFTETIQVPAHGRAGCNLTLDIHGLCLEADRARAVVWLRSWDARNGSARPKTRKPVQFGRALERNGIDFWFALDAFLALSTNKRSVQNFATACKLSVRYYDTMLHKPSPLEDQIRQGLATEKAREYNTAMSQVEALVSKLKAKAEGSGQLKEHIVITKACQSILEQGHRSLGEV
jgi:hypothetical protein